MTLSMLWTQLFYVLLGALLAWPCWLLLARALRGRQSLRCVQRYQPHLPHPINTPHLPRSPDSPPAAFADATRSTTNP